MKEILKLSGLQAYWPMGEVSGSNILNYARGTIGQNNATNNGATLGQAGKIGRAFQFDGATGSLDFSTSFDPSYSLMTLGAILVIDTAGQGTSRTIFAKRTTFSPTGMRWQASVSNLNQLYFGRSGSQAAFNTYGNNYPKDTPVFIVLQKGAANARLYVNGTLVMQVSTITDGSKADATTRIGAIDPTRSEFFRGKMQHMFITNTELSAAKILKLAQLAGLA